MSRKMWFGTRGYERWIPAPASPAEFVKSGWSSDERTYLNGGAGIRESRAGHRTYNMTWNARTRDELRPIMDFADGVYDTSDGTNLVYFVDPSVADKNIAQQSLAFPGQFDAMPLFDEVDPQLVSTAINPLGYPARSARYVLTGSEVPRIAYFPIPPRYTLWVGVHGTALGGAGLTVTPYNGPLAGAPVALSTLSVTSTTRVSESFDSTLYTGIEVSAIAAGTLTLSGVIIQVLPTGVAPVGGGYISGQGHSGCQFYGKPMQSIYQVAPNGQESIGLSARLVETGDWL